MQVSVSAGSLPRRRSPKKTRKHVTKSRESTQSRSDKSSILQIEPVRNGSLALPPGPSMGALQESTHINVALLNIICESVAGGDSGLREKLLEGLLDQIGIHYNAASLGVVLKECHKLKLFLLNTTNVIKNTAILNPVVPSSPERLTKSTPHELASLKNLAISRIDDVKPPMAGPPEAMLPNLIGNLEAGSSNLVNGHVIFDKLGNGGFGDVYRCIRQRDGKDFAIKFIRWPSGQLFNPSLYSEKSVICEKILHEVRSLKALDDHPNVVRYYDFWFERTTRRRRDTSQGSGLIIEPYLSSTDNDTSERDPSSSSESDSESDETSDSQENRTEEISLPTQFQKPRRPDFFIRNRNAEASHGGIFFETGETSDEECFEDDSYITESRALAKSEVSNWNLCITMQLCGITLETFIRDRNDECSDAVLASCGKFTEYKDIFKQITTGLEYIHNNGIIHRDIKPANIFFSRDSNIPGSNKRRVMIGDFGLSTDASNSSAHQHEVPFLDSSRLDGSAPTLPTQLALPRSDNESSRCFFSFQVGTTTYAAPEQLSGPFYNKSADMYPLGIILVELLCPFSTRTERAIEIQHLRSNAPTAIHSLKIPTDNAKDVVEKLLEKNHRSRIQSATQLLTHKFFMTEDLQSVERLTAEVAQLKRQLATAQAKNKALYERNQHLEKQFITMRMREAQN